ncbi:MAG TPA: ATP-binding protein [Acidimicrobiia bacterium]|nr:ATP-binding protein [Acidimicrobiia bacterium]
MRSQRERRFTPEPKSVSHARQFVLADGWAEDDRSRLRLATVISELVTNVILHARTSFVVSVRNHGDSIRVEVTDLSEDMPEKRSYGVLSVTGRGLHVVEAFADSWGFSPNSAGKTVWAELERERVAS